MFGCESYLYTTVLLNARIIIAIWLFVWHREFPVWGTHNLWTVTMIHDFQRQKLLALLTTRQIDMISWSYYNFCRNYIANFNCKYFFPIPSALTTVGELTIKYNIGKIIFKALQHQQPSYEYVWNVNSPRSSINNKIDLSDQLDRFRWNQRVSTEWVRQITWHSRCIPPASIKLSPSKSISRTWSI